MIKLENLYYLREAAKNHSITKAAERLFLSKSALSTAIKNLEKELGVELLNRSVSGVELSAIGEAVVRKTDLIFEIVEQIERECREYKNVDNMQEITYIMPSGMATNLFSDLMRYLRAFLNETQINVRSTNSKAKVITIVKDNEASVGFVFSQVPIENPDVHIEKIGDCEIGIVAKKHSKHIADDKKELTMADLVGVPIIQYTMENFDEMYSPTVDDEWTGMDVALSVDNQSVFWEAINNDLGVGMTTKIGMNSSTERRNAFRFIPIAAGDDIGLYMLTNHQFSNSLRDKHRQALQRLLADKQD